MRKQIQIQNFVNEVWQFVLKNVQASVFAGAFFIVLACSNVLPLGGLARYDFIFFAAIAIQIVLVLLKIETIDEVKTIFLFHIIGFCLEVFKVHPEIGSWVYPEAALFKFWGVPLYSGFMYAAVGSYISQAWKVFQVKLENDPSYWLTIPLALLVYLNFFTHHFIGDYRWYLAGAILIVFWRTKLLFTINDQQRKLPIKLLFVLLGFLIWIAENISTYLGAWQYPNQEVGWQMVSLHKVGSWSLLVIISFIIVANLKHYREVHSS